jgi:hypothetical protein
MAGVFDPKEGTGGGRVRDVIQRYNCVDGDGG